MPSGLRKAGCARSHPRSTMPIIVPRPSGRARGRAGLAGCGRSGGRSPGQPWIAGTDRSSCGRSRGASSMRQPFPVASCSQAVSWPRFSVMRSAVGSPPGGGKSNTSFAGQMIGRPANGQSLAGGGCTSPVSVSTEKPRVNLRQALDRLGIGGPGDEQAQFLLPAAAERREGGGDDGRVPLRRCLVRRPRSAALLGGWRGPIRRLIRSSHQSSSQPGIGDERRGGGPAGREPAWHWHASIHECRKMLLFTISARNVQQPQMEVSEF